MKSLRNIAALNHLEQKLEVSYPGAVQYLYPILNLLLPFSGFILYFSLLKAVFSVPGLGTIDTNTPGPFCLLYCIMLLPLLFTFTFIVYLFEADHKFLLNREPHKYNPVKLAQLRRFTPLISFVLISSAGWLISESDLILQMALSTKIQGHTFVSSLMSLTAYFFEILVVGYFFWPAKEKGAIVQVVGPVTYNS